MLGFFSETQGLAEYHVITNQPPKGGQCDVTPKTGKELDTSFTFWCSGWQDEHEPLTYEMFYSHPRDSKDPGSSQNGVLFFFGPSLTKSAFLFPAGNEEDDHFIDILVIIKDAHGESAEDKLQIKVLLLLLLTLNLVGILWLGCASHFNKLYTILACVKPPRAPQFS